MPPTTTILEFRPWLKCAWMVAVVAAAAAAAVEEVIELPSIISLRLLCVWCECRKRLVWVERGVGLKWFKWRRWCVCEWDLTVPISDWRCFKLDLGSSYCAVGNNIDFGFLILWYGQLAVNLYPEVNCERGELFSTWWGWSKTNGDQRAFGGSSSWKMGKKIRWMMLPLLEAVMIMMQVTSNWLIARH